ncbi:hypothetical protein EDB89DRAFT_2019890 [Lactarius sanguifluus]|nr:hypothetical protein EDB89DRAFT_2019890 [Lactarius sanguifluus]
MALVHDDDLERILGVGDGASLEFFKPDVMMDYFEESKPEIIESTPRQSQPANDQSPGTHTEHMTVAMLSAQLKDIADRAPPCDMDLVHDESGEGILVTGDKAVRPLAMSYYKRLNLETESVYNWPSVDDKSPRTTTDHMTVATPSFLRGGSLAAGPPVNVGHPCQVCGKHFRRLQELKRHEIDNHGPPRHCPLCLYEWRRAFQIKSHLFNTHRDVLSAETLNGISARNGRDLVEFLNTEEQFFLNEIPQACGSPTPIFPAPAKETTELPILPHPLPDYDIAEASPTALIAISRHSRQASRQPDELSID